ncbi:hypothetical protein F5B22DRAFT_275767 [Xylaria bambusicola]|uniref:uncharacterized protein n=1 Tax=Xylaria bambusicola TaxID=326684 RepID=UPI0020074D37|nr:uncharacterized protein F5B22DRAFT_275767 [Xylaria bambusicola]KAI0513158.1 hypothetical protein F5B22DRAFT_275767 [Xylaria bambusicola]
MSKFLAAATFVTAARALAFDGKPARATEAVVPDATFHLPEITEAPAIRELFKRQSGGDQTVLIGPDNTCGYVSGRAGAPITCNNDYTCAFIIQDNFGRAGCCDGDNCGLRATCLDYSQVYYSSACDNGCLQDTFTLKCTQSAAPFCNTITFFSGIEDFLCDSLNISTPQQLYTTYNGETDGRSFQEFTLTASDSASGDSDFSDFNTASEDGSFVISFTSSESPVNSGGFGGNGGSGNGGSGNNNNNNNNGNSGTDQPVEKKESTPIGPIVGGVVGGVGGLALIGLGIFFLVRHNNKKKKDALNAGPGMQQTPQTGGMAQPPPGPPGYPQQPYGGAPYDQQPYQQQPTPPQGYYPPSEQKPAGFVGVSPTGVPDRHDTTSPVSQFSDARLSVQPQSPTSTLNSNWGPQPGNPGTPNVPPTVHEAGGNVVGERDYNSNHRGQFHEMQG